MYFFTFQRIIIAFFPLISLADIFSHVLKRLMWCVLSPFSLYFAPNYQPSVISESTTYLLKYVLILIFSTQLNDILSQPMIYNMPIFNAFFVSGKIAVKLRHFSNVMR